MSACEVCWEKAWRTAQFRGTSQVDEYQMLTARGQKYHARHTRKETTMNDDDQMAEFRIAINRYDDAKDTLREATEEAQKAYQRLYDLHADMLDEKR